MINLGVLHFVLEEQGFSIGTKSRFLIFACCRSRNSWFTTVRRHAVQVIADMPIGGMPALRSRRKYDLMPVRTPNGRQGDAGVSLGAGKTRSAGQRRRRKDIFRAGAGFDGLNHECGLAIIEPLIPKSYREMLVGTDVVLASLAVRRNFFVGFIIQCIGVDEGFE